MSELIAKIKELEKKFLILIAKNPDSISVDTSEFAAEEEEIAENMTTYLFERYGLEYSNQKFDKFQDLCMDAIENMYESDDFSKYITDFLSLFFEYPDNILLNAEYDQLNQMSYI